MKNFRHFDVNNEGHLLIGGLDVKDLAESYGTPAYFYDVNFIESMAKAYIKAYERTGVKGAPSYASKAFCVKEIYRVMSGWGLFCDVVSGGELYTAIKAGFPLDKIFFHGNNKTDEEIELAIKNSVGVIVVDSYDEVEKLQEIASEFNVCQNVMIRVNPGVEAHTHHYIQTARQDSKFGFSIENGEAEKIVKIVLTKPNLRLLGLHCHIGSQIFEEKSFLIAVDKMLGFYSKLKNEVGVSFKAVNLGGGFGVWYSDGDREFSLSDYTEMLTSVLNRVKEDCAELSIPVPEVFVEPGRSMVCEAGITVYKVGAVKQIPEIKNYLAIDGGMFENPRFALYQARYTVKNPLKMNEKGVIKYSIAGKCCESGDLIAEDVMLPETKKGDLLCVFSTGAYNYSMASNYNRNTIPPVVFVKDGKSYYAVKKQTYEDVVRNDV